MKVFILWWGVLGLLVSRLPGQSYPRAVLETEKGTIVFQMFTGVAPRTVARISFLANSGFYDGIRFHRVVANFVVQAGDPGGTGEGGSGQTIPAEFSQLHYLRGSVGMARDEAIDSNDSQFFICLSEQPHLDGRYTLFGQVLGGFEVLDRIQKGDRIVRFRVQDK